MGRIFDLGVVDSMQVIKMKCIALNQDTTISGAKT